MILPARHGSPPNSLTPRRWPGESRPLREDPPAFLCAMVVFLLGQVPSVEPVHCYFGSSDGSKRTRRRGVYLLIRPSEYQVGASVAPASACGAACRRGRGGGVFDGFLPSVRISVIRTRVNSWRCPRLRREFLRRRFLKAITFGPRPCSSTSPATSAPATVGVPSRGVSPPTTSTSPNSTTSPGLPAIFSTCRTSSVATRYCLPPVLMTANIVFILVFDPGARRIRTGFFQSGFAVFWPPSGGSNACAGPEGPRRA